MEDKMNEVIIEQIAQEQGITKKQVETVLELLKEGNTIPFIARYRKEKTNALDEEQIRKINEVYEYQLNLLARKEDVIRFLGQNVIDYGLCEEGFVESVLEREQLSSTCFFDTFAIPHALDMNATHTMICVLTSESGIQWDDHVIHIVLMLAVQQNDRKKFMELYNGIVQTLEKPEKVNKLVLSDNLMDFLNQLLEK